MRRDIAVNQLDVAEVVRVMKTTRQLASDVNCNVDGEGNALFGAAIPHCPQVFAVDVVHRQIQLGLDHAGIEDRHQVAV